MKKRIFLGLVLVLLISSFVFANSEDVEEDSDFETCFDIWYNSIEEDYNPFNVCYAFCVDELEDYGNQKNSDDYDEDWAIGKCSFIPDKARLVMFSPEKLEEMDEVRLPRDENGNLRAIGSEDLACVEQEAYSMVFFDYREMDWVVIDDTNVDFDEDTGLIVSLNKEGINELLDKNLDFYYLTIIEKRVPYFNENICTLTRCPRGQDVYTLDGYYNQYDSKVIVGDSKEEGFNENWIDFIACPDPDVEFSCTEGDDYCCDGIASTVLSEDFYELHGVVGSLYGRECEEDKDCVDFFVCKEEQCMPPEGKEVIYSFEVCERLTGQSRPYCVVDLGALGDPNCVAEAYYRPSMSWEIPEESLNGKIIQTKGTTFFSLDNIEQKSDDFYQKVIQGTGLTIYHEEKTEDASSMSGRSQIMKSVYPGIYGLTNFDSCNYEIDGYCDPNCPTHEILGKKYYDSIGDIGGYKDNQQVTRYADPDCCQLTRNIDGEEVEGLAAASSEADGCCKPAGDGVCDPDCLFGQDPDCLNDFIKHPSDWVDSLNNVQDDYVFSKEDFYFVSDSTKSGSTNSMGCGNGRCDWNMWGGGRVRQPWYAKTWRSNVDALKFGAGFQVVPSFYDVIRYNWNYVQDGLNKIEEKGVPKLYTIYPFVFDWDMKTGAHREVHCKHDWTAERKVWSGCYKFHNPLKESWINNEETFPTIEGRKGNFLKGNPSNVDISYIPILDNLFSEDGFKGTSFDIEDIDFRPWYTLYPFDENPSNCPDDCIIDGMCGDEVCQPWEKEGEYVCMEDCNNVDLDFKRHVPGKEVVYTLPLNYWVGRYLDEEKEGVCLTRDRFQEIEVKFVSNSKALCSFAYPGQQGNCPAGSVCGYNCECLPMSDVANIVSYIDNLKNEVYPDSYFEGEDFYRNLLKNLDRDLDGWPACTDDENLFSGKCDCNDYDTSINPDAIDFCDGVDRDCNGITDDFQRSQIPSSACDMDMWICGEDEFIIHDGEISGCYEPYCKKLKGDGGGEIFRCTFDDIGSLEPSFKPYDYYVYFCDPDNIDERCDDYTFKGEFQVCWDSEDAEPGFCSDGIDNDCDGLVDTDDPDCYFCDPTNPISRCNLMTKEWCKEGVEENDAPGWVSEEYCSNDACGMYDSSCVEGAEVCEEGELSCGKGCFPSACDIDAQKVCNEQGVWVGGEEYNEACFKYDQRIENGDCEQGACDYVNEWTCSNSREWAGGGALHCLSQAACGLKYDSDCNGECEPGACDTEHNKYCTDENKWKAQDYCSKCGYTDADCGVQACEQGACDFMALKVCDGGVWVEKTEDQFCDGVCEETTYCKAIEEEMQLFIDAGEDACWPGEEANCGTDVGECEFGTKVCQEDYSWGECVGGVGPNSEVCDGTDNNCDGSVDEGCQCEVGEVRRCGSNEGQCSSGLQECTEEGLWGVCYGISYNQPSESSCDGTDNNCDGNIDVGCICTPGETQPCGESEGECQQGVQTCLNNVWGECFGIKGPSQELCADGLDNDCDKLIDMEDEDCHKDLPPLESSGDQQSSSPSVEPPVDESVGGDETNDETIFKPEEKEFPIFTLILALLFLGVLGGAGFLVFKNIKSGRKPLDITWLKNKFQGKTKVQSNKETSSKKDFNKPSYKSQQPQKKISRKDKFKTKEEKALEDSFKKSQDMFK